MGKIRSTCAAMASYMLVSCSQGTTEAENTLNANSHNPTTHNPTAPIEHPAKADRPTPSHLKPGAAIRLKHDYDGHTEVGETELIQLSFNESYPYGELQIGLKADPGLSIEPQTAVQTFAMDNGDLHTVALTARAEAPGKYYITIYASAVDQLGRAQDRVFALALKVASSAKASKIQAQSSSGSTEENLIYLPSTETSVK